MKKLLLPSLILAVFLFNSYLFINIQSVTALTKCFYTKLGNPPGEKPNPVECQGGGGNWPFPDKGLTQFKRIDEGWDLQYTQATTVHAMAPGTIRQARSDPSGFGPDYPIEDLEKPIPGYPDYPSLYYGHVHIDPNVIGKHVKTGDVIAHTDPTGATAGGFTNWLEVGFWDDKKGGPAAKPHYKGGESETIEGQQMKNWLLNGDTATDINKLP